MHGKAPTVLLVSLHLLLAVIGPPFQDPLILESPTDLRFRFFS